MSDSPDPSDNHDSADNDDTAIAELLGDDTSDDDDRLDEVRQAAGAVVASLKWLLDASERVIEDPEAFAHIVKSGRSVVEAFASGFMSESETDADDAETSSET